MSNDQKAEAASEMSAHIALGHGQMTATDVDYRIPGALVQLNGAYSMDGNLFEFKGHVRTEATASQMVGGWKGLLLKPVDRFLQKPGAGLQLPIEISGTGSNFHFGLAMHGAEESPEDIARDLKQNRRNLAAHTEHKSEHDAEKDRKQADKEQKKEAKAEKRAEKRAERQRASQDASTPQ